jgi:hypothetical protein
MTEINSKITSLKKLESIGRRPLRYWLMMYIVFLIPLWFYVEYSKQTLPLNISWYSGILISFGVLISLYFISHIIEYITISD